MIAIDTDSDVMMDDDAPQWPLAFINDPENSVTPGGLQNIANLYRAFANDPINKSDPDGLSPVTTQPASRYAGTFLENMTPTAAAAIANALAASPNGRLTNAQAFAIPLTNTDAMIYLNAMGKTSFAVTSGILRNAIEDRGLFQTMFGDGGYAYDSYADALKKNTSLGMTRDQYYESLASAHNIQMARDAMQLQGYMMANLYARLAIPTAN